MAYKGGVHLQATIDNLDSQNARLIFKHVVVSTYVKSTGFFMLENLGSQNAINFFFPLCFQSVFSIVVWTIYKVDNWNGLEIYMAIKLHLLN